MRTYRICEPERPPARIIVPGKRPALETVTRITWRKGLRPDQLSDCASPGWRAAVHNPAADDRGLDPHVTDGLGLDGENVVAEDHHVRELAGRDRALLFFLKFRERRSQGVGLDRLGERDLLLRNPALGILSVERRARDRRIQPEQRIERRHVP